MAMAADISRQAAEAQIQRIQQKYSLSGHDELADLIDNSIEILANELYDVSTHFIQELLQNADDNDYVCDTPMLKFTYSPGVLRVDCNETGFTPANIDAICAIRKSTKLGSHASKCYTGEKGIGFKSVFRIADVVWISTGDYSFKFDKSRRFGMVSPEWGEFPQHRIEGYTSFQLNLSSDFDQNELVEALTDFDPAQLIFLKQLRRVDIELIRPGGQVLTKSLHRTDKKIGSGVMTTLEFGDLKKEYIVWNHKVFHMPFETKRPARSASELVLAFPVSDVERELPSRENNVYAGQPVGHCSGLTFLMHGDFLLSANRLHIDTSRPWNRKLRDGLVSAFIGAIGYLRTTSLRYLWPLFIPFRSEDAGFLEPAFQNIVTQLQNVEFLESCSGSVRNPLNLVLVDREEFLSVDGVSFTLHPCTAHRYLSGKYHPGSFPAMKALGVRSLSEEVVLEHFKAIIMHDPLGFTSCSPEWHESVARGLSSVARDSKLRSELIKLPIVPLASGPWVPADGRPVPVLISDKISLEEFPISDVMAIVDPSASTSHARAELFLQLGLRRMGTAGLCKYIFEKHSSPTFRAEDWGTKQLIAYAKLLYRKPRALPPDGKREFWLASACGKRYKGSELYLHEILDKDSPQGRVANLLRKHSFPEVHPDYYKQEVDSERTTGKWDIKSSSTRGTGTYTDQSEETLMRDQSWKRFLTSQLQVATCLRLVHGQEISKELRCALEHNAADVIDTLLASWSSYGKLLEEEIYQEETAESRELRTKLINEIGEAQVQTSMGRQRIKETFIPRVDNFLPLELTPELPLYRKLTQTVCSRLSLLGVSIKPNGALYISALIALKSSAEPSRATISHIYEQIQKNFEDNAKMIGDSFGKSDLVYARRKEEKSKDVGWQWMSMSECVRQNIDIEALYPRSKHLFRRLITNSKSSLRKLITKITKSKKSGTSQDIAEVLDEVDDILLLMSTRQASSVVRPLISEPVFPVLEPNQAKTNRPKKVSARDRNWFIADRPHLRRSFEGKVPLLDFTTTQIEFMPNVLDAFDLNSRRLSELVKSEKRPRGWLELDIPLTMFFRDRHSFIFDLISSQNWEDLSKQIKQVSVSRVAEISENFMLQIEDSQVHGISAKSLAMASVTGTGLQIFIADRKLPIPAIVQLLSDHCGIKKPPHLCLLYTLFSEPDQEKVEEAFSQAGYHSFFEKDAMRSNPAARYWEKSGSLITVPSPYDYDDQSDSDSNPDLNDHGPRFGVKYKFTAKRFVRRKEKRFTRDRRLPICCNVDRDCSTHVTERLHYETLACLGQNLLSNLLKCEVGAAYSCLTHWTSPLRTRTGLCPLITTKDIQELSPFTFVGTRISRAVSDFLIKNDISEARVWRETSPNFHFELAISVGGTNDPFLWTSKQLQRARELHLRGVDGYDKPDDILVMVRISDVYTQPTYQLFLDPWSMIWSEEMRIMEGSVFKAVIQVQDNQGPNLWREPKSISLDPLARDLDSTSLVLPSRPQVQPTEQQNSQVRELATSSATQLESFWHDEFHNSDSFRHCRHPVSRSHYLQATEKSSQPEPSLSFPFSPVINMSWGDQLPYSYRELNSGEIRLFCLFPGVKEDEIRGMIVTIPFQEAMAYHAVSYVWGDPEQPRLKILTPNGVLSVHESIHRALKRLRSQDEPVMLWADAICINQKSNREKADQLQLLPRIFQSAVSTLAILGQNQKSETAIEQIADLSKRLNAKGQIFDGSVDEAMDWHDSILQHLDTILSHPWFERAWIIQEAVASPHVTMICGKYAIDWDDLYEATHRLSRHMPSIDAGSCPPWSSFCALGELRIWESRGQRWSILLLLEAFRKVKSTLARDRFFSLLGIACDGDLEGFEPDYNAPLAAVVLKFARCLVKQGMGMMLLYRAGLSAQPDRFPSWIPDWTIPKAPGLNASLPRGVVFNACGDTEANIKCLDDDDATSDVLQVEGYLVDKIQSISHSKNLQSSMKAYFDEIDKMTTSPELRYSVPIAGAKHAQVAVAEALDLKESYKAFRKLLKKQKWTKKYNGSISKPSPPSYSPTEDMGLVMKSKSYMALLGGTIEGWRFVTTEAGRCGITRPEAEAGDIIVVVAGGEVPFVLRKSKDRKGSYRLLGECYISDIMYGEFLKTDRPDREFFTVY